MLFDSLGLYYGTAHPDNNSHGDTAYGSMKQYWKEASNSKFDLIPYPTRTFNPNIDNRLNRGIINDYEIINGVPIIKNMMLPKNKYGLDQNTSYFRSYEDAFSLDTKGFLILADAENIINTQTNFDLDSFRANGGILMVVFAGSQQSFKGIGQPQPDVRRFVVRGRLNIMTNLENTRIDGFGITAHEYGHIAFNWFAHTVSGRYDIMNLFDVHFKDCPQLPNPIFRMQQGWLNPIALKNTQQVLNLQSIETSFQCGVVSVYGDPSVAPDWSTGECFVIENRRKIGYDRMIARNFPDFLGGLLIWHYSPYKNLSPHQCSNGGFVYSTIKLISANGESNLCGNTGDPLHFFAYDDENGLELFDSSRTHSAASVKTGIELRNIEQINYSDLYSSIKFNLNYLISEPPVYNYVIYQRGGDPREITLSGNVFYHEFDNKEFYGVLPGTIIDVCSKDGTKMTFNNIEAKGEVNNYITFRGPGFRIMSASYISNYNKGISIRGLSSYESIDSCILENVKIEDVEPGVLELSCNDSSALPISLKNINVTPNFENKSDYDIELRNYINDLDLNNMQIWCRNTTRFKGDIFINSSRVTFSGIKLFALGISVLFTNTIIDNILNNSHPFVEFNELSAGSLWQGLRLDGGSINLDNSEGHPPVIKNAIIGIDITASTGEVIIRNSKFENNRDYDISIYKISNESDEKPRISNNTFSQDNNTNVKIASIIVNECPNIDIDTNTITNTGYFGIILMNVESPSINNNSITGGNINGTHSSGIFSYNSNGYYKCNAVSQCMNYGVMLDNSQPVLFNNEIFVNGLGLYLSNNSNPILTPGYLINETYVIGGYNNIHHNAGKEIYCNNSKINNSVPIMYKGFNSVLDSVGFLPDTLIYNKNSSAAPHIDAIGNYWGGSSPAGRLIPDNSFTYDPYLTSQFSHGCEYSSEPADNASMPIEYLLLGNVLKYQQQQNYDIALNYSNQLIDLQNSEINPVISFNDLFTANLLSNGNFINLENYYLSLISQYPEDFVISNKLLNLSIESKIARNELEEAISEYDEILNTNTDEEVIFYASIDRSRAIRLLLDSLLSHYQGDNSGQNIDQMYDNAINYEIRINNSAKELNQETQRVSNSNGRDKKFIVRSNSESNFTALNKSIRERKKHFEKLSGREKRNLIIEKNILDISMNNYVEGIASIKDKLQYLNQKTLEISRTYKLKQNYPNPFNPVTYLEFEISQLGFVSLKVYDILGKEVKTLVNEIKQPGIYQVEFDGSNLASGAYFYRLESGDFVDIKRMILLK